MKISHRYMKARQISASGLAKSSGTRVSSNIIPVFLYSTGFEGDTRAPDAGPTHEALSAPGRPVHDHFHFGSVGPTYPVSSRSRSGPDTIFRLCSKIRPASVRPAGKMTMNSQGLDQVAEFPHRVAGRSARGNSLDDGGDGWRNHVRQCSLM